MADDARQLAEARELRDAARSAFEAHFTDAKANLSPGGIGKRVAGQVARDAKDTLDFGLEVARESKGIIAGTVAALALWFLRAPIMARIDALIESLTSDHEDPTDDRD